jgi:hypothetical protein
VLGGTSRGSPELSYVGWCDNRPNVNLPCIQGDLGPNNKAGSRSRHSGGVHVAIADTSNRFVSDDVGREERPSL